MSAAKLISGGTAPRRATLGRPVAVTGTGLHSGEAVRLRLEPAEEGTGIVFYSGTTAIPAHARYVTDTRLCTVLGRGEASVATVEHLMAALAGRGLSDVAIHVDGPEIPAVDGSSAPFGFLLEAAGRQDLCEPRPLLRVLQAVEVSEGDRLVRLEPSDGYQIDLTIAFDDPAIGTMRRSYTHGPGRFDAELARARTFGFLHEVEGLKAMGLARGGSLANAVVVEEGRVLNRDGLRAPDEFVRHKLLDCFGDLALAGGLLAAKVRAVKPGHRLHIAALNALLATPGAYVWEPEPPLAAEALAA